MLLLRALLLAILIYFIFKVVRNLIRAIREDGQPPRRVVPPQAPYQEPWRAYGPENGAAARRSGRDVEDAKWKDLP